MLSSAVFDNTGKPYDVTKILTPDFLFDEAAYKAYSPVYLPITYVLSYAVQFASLTALVTHTACWHGRDIWKQSKKAFTERYDDESKSNYQPIPTTPDPHLSNQATNLPQASTENMMSGAEDVHNRLMRRYPDAPIHWYLTTFLIMLLTGIFVVEYYPTHLPWHGLLLALTIPSLLFIPVGLVMAITNQQSSLYLICQLTAGHLFPGRPIANMVFVSYSYIASAQGLKFSADLKLGHYMKLPPRLLFSVQLHATLIASLTQIAVLNWTFTHLPTLCDPDAPNGFTCPLARVHFNGSILWGLVGPSRFFLGPTALYRNLIWAFPLGALAPPAAYLVARSRGPRSRWRYLNLPVLLGSLAWIPPATTLNFAGWAAIAFAFDRLARRGYAQWWAKYTMTLSAALDSGLAFAVLVVFFGVVYPGWMGGFEWWGTRVYKAGCDWRACAWLGLREGEKFGLTG
jgi:OPT family small oligopeptide transporter